VVGAPLPELPPNIVTQLLASWQAGDEDALRSVIPLMYDELRRVAHRYLRQERPGHTLQSTALVHEAYLRLEKQGTVRFQNRQHFLAIFAYLMRQILIEHGRAQRAEKRDGGIRVVLDDAIGSKMRDVDVVALEDALTELEKLSPEQCRIVVLRFMAGLTIEETAEAMGSSPATVKRHWETARLWLHRQISQNSRT
jgi:RNA polymerase sigma factor (TIGR02999 family)